MNGGTQITPEKQPASSLVTFEMFSEAISRPVVRVRWWTRLLWRVRG